MSATTRTSKFVTNTNSIYHPHKTFNISDKSIPTFSVQELQMKLELKTQVIFTDSVLNYESIDWIVPFL